MQFCGLNQPPKGKSDGYFYTTADISRDNFLIRLLWPWLSAIAVVHNCDVARVVKDLQFGLRNPQQNRREKDADPEQARKDAILKHALAQSLKAKTPEEHAATVRLMAVLSMDDAEVAKVHLDLFGRDEADVPFAKTIGPTEDQILDHLQSITEAIVARREESKKKAG